MVTATVQYTYVLCLPSVIFYAVVCSGYIIMKDTAYESENACNVCSINENQKCYELGDQPRLHMVQNMWKN